MSTKEEIAGECYQLAGMLGAPERVLDSLCAAADGKPFKSFLPVSPDECVDREALRVIAGFPDRDAMFAYCSKHGLKFNVNEPPYLTMAKIAKSAL